MYRILLADDNSSTRFIYSKITVWNECGFKIGKAVSNGKDALNALEKEKFDLVIAEIKMPFIDGTELLREIKKQYPDVCVIFISSCDKFEYVREALIGGAFDYILKPVDKKVLGDTLMRARQYLSERSKDIPISENVKAALQFIGKKADESVFIKQVCEYFSQNSKTVITMEKMADHLNFNKDYFGKIFKRQTGVSFSRFASVLKAEYAKELIATGNYKIYQISEMLGYSSTDYFTKKFKEITGKTPSEFKKQY